MLAIARPSIWTPAQARPRNRTCPKCSRAGAGLLDRAKRLRAHFSELWATGISMNSRGRIFSSRGMKMGSTESPCCCKKYRQSRLCRDGSLSGLWLAVDDVPASGSIIQDGHCYAFDATTDASTHDTLHVDYEEITSCSSEPRCCRWCGEDPVPSYWTVTFDVPGLTGNCLFQSFGCQKSTGSLDGLSYDLGLTSACQWGYITDSGPITYDTMGSDYPFGPFFPTPICDVCNGYGMEASNRMGIGLVLDSATSLAFSVVFQSLTQTYPSIASLYASVSFDDPISCQDGITFDIDLPYQDSGPDPYNNVYSGPSGSILTGTITLTPHA